MFSNRIARLRMVAGAAIVLTAGSLSGCGATASSSGGPIELFQIAPLDSPVYSAVEFVPSAQAAVDQINAAGGINGRKLELTSCNDKYDANTAISCAQKAVQSNAVAVVGSLSAFADQTGPILAAKKIPNIGPNGLVPSDYTNKLVYLIDPGVAAYSGSPFVLKKYAGVTKIATLSVENPSNDVTNGYFETGAKLVGSQVVAKIAVPADAVDWLPYLNKAVQAGANGIVTSLDPQSTLKLWSALKAGNLVSKLPVTVTSTSIPQAVLDEADPSSITNTYGIAEVPLLNTNADYTKQYVAEEHKESPKIAPTSTGMRVWASIHVFADIAKTIKGPITPTSVDKALDTNQGLSLLWLKDLKWPGPSSDYPRIGYTKVGANKVKNGKFVNLGSFDVTNPS